MTATVTNTHSAPTAKQIAYAETLSTKAGYRYLSQAQKDCFGKCRVGEMNRSQLSELISWLQAR